MTGILRIFFLFLLVGLARWLISQLKNKGKSSTIPKKKAPAVKQGKIIKDPHCGTYVAPELAVSTVHFGKKLLFCSESCREAYIKTQTKHSAAS